MIRIVILILLSIQVCPREISGGHISYLPTRELIKEKREVIVGDFINGITGTYYHPDVFQTDSTPLITSDMSVIDTSKLENLRWCALSRDLLNVPILAKKDSIGKHWRGPFNYGDTIYVQATKRTSKHQIEKVVGKWVVHDCMNPRYSKTIDFLVHKDYFNGGKWHSLRIVKSKTMVILKPGYNMRRYKKSVNLTG